MTTLNDHLLSYNLRGFVVVRPDAPYALRTLLMRGNSYKEVLQHEEPLLVLITSRNRFAGTGTASRFFLAHGITVQWATCDTTDLQDMLKATRWCAYAMVVDGDSLTFAVANNECGWDLPPLPDGTDDDDRLSLEVIK